MGYLTWVFRETEEANRRAILEALPGGVGGALLDLGTSSGEFTIRVARRVAADHTVGVELLPAHARAAETLGIEVVQHDLEDGLPFESGLFRVVHANQVIEHVRRTDRLVREIRRVLAPGGVACISTNNLASWHNIVSLALGLQPMPLHVSDERIIGNPLNPEHGREHVDVGRTHVRLFTARSLVELCRLHGLDRMAVRAVGYYPLPPGIGRIAAKVDPIHGAFVTALFRPA
jgi:SAM-dependent methyltransferase